MKHFLTILYIGINYLIIAQTIPYQKLDSLSTVFSKYQLEANGYSYNDGSQNYEVSFPEQNFKIWSYNRKASYSIYKKWGDKEILASTDNIDLTKVDSIQWLKSWQATKSEKLLVFRIYFPKNSLTTQLYENGKLTKTINEGYIDYFISFTDQEKLTSFKFMKFYMEFIDLIYSLKEEKNMKTPFSLEQIKKDWLLALDDQSSNWSSENLKSFITKYSNSLYFSYATKIYNLIKGAELKEKQKLDVNRKFVNDIANQYKFKKGLTLSQFTSYNPESMKLYNSKSESFGEHTSYSAKMSAKNYLGNPWSQGPGSMSVNNKTEIIDSYSYIAFAGKKEDVLTSYSNFYSSITQNVSPDYLTKLSDGGIIIDVPGSLSKIHIDCRYFNNKGAWIITFSMPTE